jgi:hypothetical protein
MQACALHVGTIALRRANSAAPMAAHANRVEQDALGVDWPVGCVSAERVENHDDDEPPPRENDPPRTDQRHETR